MFLYIKIKTNIIHQKCNPTDQSDSLIKDLRTSSETSVDKVPMLPLITLTTLMAKS